MKGLERARCIGIPYEMFGDEYLSCLWAEDVRYQRRLAALLAIWRSDTVAPTVPNVPLSCLDEDWSQLWLVVQRRYWTREHHFEIFFRMHHNVLVVWHNIDMFSIMPANRSGLYTIFTSWWDEYK